MPLHQTRRHTAALDVTSYDLMLGVGQGQYPCRRWRSHTKALPMKGVHPIWRETSIRSGTLHPFPSCAGVERRLRACALRRRDGVCGRPPLWPAGDPVAEARLASGRLCHRLSGGRMLVAVVLHLLCADKSAGSVGHVKCRSRWWKRRTLKNAATPPGERARVDLVCVRGLAAGYKRSLILPRPGQFFVHELDHRKLDGRFACIRRTSSIVRKEIVTRSATTPRNPFHSRR